MGDYAPLMARICTHLTEAIHHAANPTQVAMLRRYIASFRYGGMVDHIDASRHWVKDVGPAVESYIGFIESYRDPLGTRGEWEGFVAVVNKETSAKFGTLVSTPGPAADWIMMTSEAAVVGTPYLFLGVLAICPGACRWTMPRQC